MRPDASFFLYAPPGPLPEDRLDASLVFLAQARCSEEEVPRRVPHPGQEAALARLIQSGAIERLERSSLEARFGPMGPLTLVDLWQQAHADMQLVWHEDGSALGRDDLQDLVARIRGVIRARGVEPGEMVVVELTAHPLCWAVWWAVVTAGGVPAALVTGLTGDPLRHVCALTEARLAIVISPETLADLPIDGLAIGDAGDTLLQALGEPDPVLARPRPFDRACARFTSGTTGLPKGVVLTHNSMVRSTRQWAAELGQSGDRHLMWGNQAHTLGLRHMMLLPTFLGTTVICAHRVGEPLELLKLAVEHGSTILHSNPTFWLSVCRVESALKEVLGETRFRQIGSTSAPLPESVRHTAERLFQLPVTNFFGTSESCGVHLLRIGDGTGSGTPFHALAGVFLDDGTRCAPGALGKLRVFSPRMSDGYLDERALLIDEHGWLATGDHAHETPDGSFVLHGRLDDVFVHRLGENVHMGGVQRAIEALDGVLEASVVGIEDRGVARLAALFVGTADARALQQALADKLPDNHIPERWLQRSHIPRTRAGKTDRNGVAALFVEDP